MLLENISSMALAPPHQDFKTLYIPCDSTLIVLICASMPPVYAFALPNSIEFGPTQSVVASPAFHATIF